MKPNKIIEEISNLTSKELFEDNKCLLGDLYNLNLFLSDFLSCFKYHTIITKRDFFKGDDEISNEKEKCEVCERTLITPIFHHKNGDKGNNSKDNILRLCLDCHTAIHHKISGKVGRKGGKNKIRNYEGKLEIKERIEDLENELIKQGGKQNDSD